MNSFFILAVLVSVFDGYLSSILTCRYESNVEYVGCRIGGAYYVSAGQCCYMCTKDPLCKAWTYDKRQNYCVLRGSSQYRRYRCGQMSGYKGTYDSMPPFVTETTPVPSATTPVSGTTAVSGTTTAKASSCIIEFNSNYPGNDIGGSYNVDSIDECCNLCGSNPSCFSFAYLESSKYCFFKGQTNPDQREDYDGITSGVVTIR
ncbi:coagulation factor XI-like [Brachionus plicatilis]|uniref:Coagulation factor XI-like n=1 Tax=Brachionus plicatilis TaxID=10195 RepID=A0A3M7T8X2_BRAPC|nr:coagulation factor XI-like [Brachionus plicatilis]